MLDMEKILTQPNEAAREQEILNQVRDFIGGQSLEDRIDSVVGIVASLVQQSLNNSEYLNNLTTALNQFWAMANAPFQMLTFPDWLETKDMDLEQRKKWLEEKNLAFQKRQRKIKLLGEEG